MQSRQLYNILGEVLSNVFKDNQNLYLDQPLSEILESSIFIDRKLFAWKENLPAEFKTHTWLKDPNELPRLHNDSAIFVWLSTILHLRYLNVRILKDRAVLSWFLLRISKYQSSGSRPDPTELDFTDVAQTNLTRIKDMATETIEIIGKASRCSQSLGAWWFSTYSVVNSCLVLLGYILVYFYSTQHHIFGSLKMDEKEPLTTVLAAMEKTIFKGLQAIQDIPKGAHGVIKVHRALDKVTNFTTCLLTSIRTECLNCGSNNPAEDNSNSGRDVGTLRNRNALPDLPTIIPGDGQVPSASVAAQALGDTFSGSSLSFASGFELPDLMLGGVDLHGDLNDIDLDFCNLNRM